MSPHICICMRMAFYMTIIQGEGFIKKRKKFPEIFFEKTIF